MTDAPPPPPDPQGYDADRIRVLGDIEAVRERPGMYVGDTGPRGLHHLVFEVVDNSIDEAMAGFATSIQVRLSPDGSATVIDDGRGIPVDIHKEEGRSALEVVMTTLHAGGKFDSKAYTVSAGLHGVGVSAVCALSEWMEAEVWRDGHEHVQRYVRGKPEGPVARKGKTDRRGTRVTFKPDPQIFKDTTTFVYETLVKRLRELAFLMKGLSISIADERTGKKETFRFEGGISEFVRWVNHGKKPLHPEVIHFERTVESVQIEVAMQYNETYNESIFAFANSINTHDGGTHLTGFRTALTRTLNQAAKERELLGEKDKLPTGDDYREGLTAVINVRLQNPQFESQTKVKLTNTDVEGMVNTVVGDELKHHLDRHPDTARTIIGKATLASRAREAARQARELVRKTALASGSLPGKLADCSSRGREGTELFLVEGDSAGGCFSGETRVALADGRSPTFRRLLQEWRAGRKNTCYTVQADGRIGVAPIVNVRRTRRAAPVVRVILDDETPIVCTPDHRFMLRNGEYREAARLQPGDSLMPLRRQASKPGTHDRVFADLMTDLFQHEVCPDVPHPMLPRMGTDDGGSTRMRIETLQLPSITSLRSVGIRRHPRPSVDSLGRDGRFRLEEAVRNFNHTVLRVESLTEHRDVYDLEVPETHNFALAAGVFVHNSAKMGRDRRIQAILPLKGKILNVQKARIDRMLKHEEIRTLITAVGTGIGEDEFSLEKLRYGKIIILCDADVDGSHIRTLLMTFFFWHMRPLIEAGHLYLAQPPLYRVKRGKNIQYVHSDLELTRALIRLGLEGTRFTQGARTLEAADLGALVEKILKLEEICGHLARKSVSPAAFFRRFEGGRLPRVRIRRGAQEHYFFSEAEQDAFIQEIARREKVEPAVFDDESDLPDPPPKDPCIVTELLETAEAGPALEALAAAGLPAEDPPGDDAPPVGLLVNEGQESPVCSARGLVRRLRQFGQKGLEVQRFKGLGEMNPDQLWETTMDPARRMLLRVSIEDAIHAERIFTVLMGDEVEPRRRFIERHALEVKFLDV